MSASSVLFQESIVENKLTVSFRVILGLYSIIPICLIAYLADIFFLDYYLQSTLPKDPAQFLLFQILFGTPHIIASAILLTSNKEYMHFFKYKLIGMTCLIILVFGVGSLYLSHRALYVATVGWTVYHALKQQHGIAKGIYRLPNWAFYWLLWLSVSIGVFVFTGTYLKDSLTPEIVSWFQLIAGILTAGLILSTIFCQRYVSTQFGKLFLWSNSFLVISSFYFYVEQYYFLAILIPRLVHDTTAYIFYVTHDYNKHHKNQQNIIYKYAKRCNLHVFLVLPLASFVLTYLLQHYGDIWINLITDFFFGMNVRISIASVIVTYVSLMHFYAESFLWQANSPMRKFILFSK